MSESPSTTADLRRRTKATRLSDLRIVIGGLFLLYGVILMVASVFTTTADLHKAQGVDINLWTGLGMFVTGALFSLWAALRPISEQEVVAAMDDAYPEQEAAAEEGARARP